MNPMHRARDTGPGNENFSLSHIAKRSPKTPGCAVCYAQDDSLLSVRIYLVLKLESIHDIIHFDVGRYSSTDLSLS